MTPPSAFVTHPSGNATGHPTARKPPGALLLVREPLMMSMAIAAVAVARGMIPSIAMCTCYTARLGTD